MAKKQYKLIMPAELHDIAKSRQKKLFINSFNQYIIELIKKDNKIKL